MLAMDSLEVYGMKSGRLERDVFTEIDFKLIWERGFQATRGDRIRPVNRILNPISS